MFVTDVKCSGVTWETVSSWRTGGSTASVSEAAVRTSHYAGDAEPQCVTRRRCTEERRRHRRTRAVWKHCWACWSSPVRGPLVLVGRPPAAHNTRSRAPADENFIDFRGSFLSVSSFICVCVAVVHRVCGRRTDFHRFYAPLFIAEIETRYVLSSPGRPFSQTNLHTDTRVGQ